VRWRAVYESNGTQRIEFGFPTPLGPRFFDGVLVPGTQPANGRDQRPRHFTERHAAEAWARKLSLGRRAEPGNESLPIPTYRVRQRQTGYTKDAAILKSGASRRRTPLSHGGPSREQAP
jgi:hypothetical protein